MLSVSPQRGQRPGWRRFVRFIGASEDIADELAERLAAQDHQTPTRLASFIERHGGGRPVQLPLPLRGAA